MLQDSTNLSTSNLVINNMHDSTSILTDSITRQDSVEFLLKPMKSLFEGSQILANKIQPIPHSQFNEDWITVHLIILLGLIAWAGMYYRKRFSQVIQGLFSYHNQTLITREGNIMREQISLVLLFAYFVSFSLLIYLFLSRQTVSTPYNLHGFKLFSLILLVLLSIWIFKNLALVFTGVLFKNPLINHDFILNNFIHTASLGLLLLPSNIIAFYYSTNVGLMIGIILWFSIFVFRTLRQLTIGFGVVEFSFFNRILYLCTFEIAPFLVVIKLIMNKLG